MNSEFRQTAIVVALAAVFGLGFVVWITTTPPAKTPKAVPPVTMADSPVRDPNAPFAPVVGQPGKDVVWVPTADKLVETMLRVGSVTASDYLIDLGSGDGRTVIAAAQRGATALGIEFNAEMVELSQKNAVAANVTDRATFVRGDLFKADLSKATVITMFLLPQINLQLRPTLLGLKPGTRIVSNSFTMGDWEADHAEAVGEPDCKTWCTALLWIVPADVGGTWAMPDVRLQLTQKYQKVSGTLAGKPIADGALNGDALVFSVGATKYEARVTGESLAGTSNPGGAWTARRTARPAKPVPKPTQK